MNADSIAQPQPTARHAPRYFAWLYSAPEKQTLLQTLLAIEAEVRGVLQPGMEHRVAHVRLEWWRAEADRVSAGQPAHPLTRALPPSAAQIGGLVDTTVWDLASATFSTREEIAGYCDRWATAMTKPLAPDIPAAIAIGAAIREIELLSELATEARSGRLRLPLDELERADVAVEALAKPPWPAKLCAVLRARHHDMRRALGQHIAAMPAQGQAAARGLLVWAALAARQSQRAEKTLPCESEQSRSAMLLDAWAGWRSARRAQSGSFRLS